MTTDVYAALESFLLLRNLQPTDASASSFAAASESLKSNSILRNSDDFDASRLNPDTLKALYLRLLKDEAKSHAKRDASGQTPSSPKTQMQSSPRLENLEEASQFSHLLPQMVERLYLYYQSAVAQAIIQDEQRYHHLQTKIEQAERTQAVERERKSDTSQKPASHGVPSIHTLLRHEDEQASRDAKPPPSDTPKIATQRLDAPPPVNGAPHLPRFSKPTEVRNSPNEHRPPQQAPYRPGSLGSAAESIPSYLPATQHPPQTYAVPSNDFHPRRPPHQSAGLSSSPRPIHASISPQERASASPILLPPVSGMLRNQNNGGHPDVHAEAQAQQRRLGQNVSPAPNSQTPPWPHPNRLPPPQSYGQQPYSYGESQAYPPYHHYNPAYRAHPYHAPATPRGSAYGAPSPYATPVQAHPQYSNYQSSVMYYNPALHTPYGQQMPTGYGEQQVQSSSTPDRRRPAPLTAINTSTSSTKWKNVDLKGAKPPGSPLRPPSRDISPISPISDRMKSREPEVSSAVQRGAQNQQQVGDSAKRNLPGSTRASLAPRKGRGGQTAGTPTPARERTRSDSVTSQAGDLQADLRSSKIKSDPSVTSAHEDDIPLSADESRRRPDRRRRDTTRDNDRPTTPTRTAIKRKRGDSISLSLASPSLRSNLTGPPPRRKLQPHKPGFVLAIRNLPRASSALLNMITAHKFASLFAKPLTEREAPGYNSIVFRVQDLKSVKAAVSAGSRTVAAIAEQEKESIPSGTNILWVPETEDVIPPKGIVNGSQLEKELIRVFANAVMFNPDMAENRGMGPVFRARERTMAGHLSRQDGESGDPESNNEMESVKFEIGVARPEAGAVVKDARDMFNAVEEFLDEWRGVGAVSEDEAREAPIVGDSRSSVKDAKGKAASSHGDEEEEARPKRRRR